MHFCQRLLDPKEGMQYTEVMTAFLHRNYRVLSIMLIMAIAGLSFYVGMLEGGRGGDGSAVTLSCSDDVLARLTIPVERLVRDQAQDGIVAGVSSTTTDTRTPGPTQGRFAGSKNGTKYYTPGCAGLNRIKPENIIWFQDAEDATLQGYTPANC